jgi:hypothetical protein
MSPVAAAGLARITIGAGYRGVCRIERPRRRNPIFAADVSVWLSPTSRQNVLVSMTEGLAGRPPRTRGCERDCYVAFRKYLSPAAFKLKYQEIQMAA